MADGTPTRWRVSCPAKLNLYLEVVRRRPDGYHDIDTVMQAIDLCDELAVEPAEGDALRLECSDPGLPADESNLVLRAATALRNATGHRAGAALRLTKRIPQQAGLGGGSSDAAGALVGLNRLWGLGLSRAELAEIAAQVGSDVAFFLTGGLARCTGRGEVVEPIEAEWEPCFVVLCPPIRVSTAEVYAGLSFPLTPAGAGATMLSHCAASGDLEGVGGALFNRLEAVAFAMHPGLQDRRRLLEGSGLFVGVRMSGSGSALFGLCHPSHWRPTSERVAAMHLGTSYRVRGIGRGAEAYPE